jgi:hypothetical protein
LPPGRWGQSRLEGDPLRFSCDEISRIRVSHGTKVIRSRIVLGTNQEFSRRLLKKSGNEVSGKIEDLNAE